MHKLFHLADFNPVDNPESWRRALYRLASPETREYFFMGFRWLAHHVFHRLTAGDHVFLVNWKTKEQIPGVCKVTNIDQDGNLTYIIVSTPAGHPLSTHGEDVHILKNDLVNYLFLRILKSS